MWKFRRSQKSILKPFLLSICKNFDVFEEILLIEVVWLKNQVSIYNKTKVMQLDFRPSECYSVAEIGSFCSNFKSMEQSLLSATSKTRLFTFDKYILHQKCFCFWGFGMLALIQYDNRCFIEKMISGLKRPLRHYLLWFSMRIAAS